jgi:hypothetical protein
VVTVEAQWAKPLLLSQDTALPEVEVEAKNMR